MVNKVYTHIQKLDAETQALLQPYLNHPSMDEWVRDVLLSYFNYFLDIDETDEATAKKGLRAALKPLVPVGMRKSLDKIEGFLSDEFRRKGFYFLGGMTGPYYGPYLWKKTEKRTFEVELPDRRENLSVFFMYEFLLCSWMHFQTFGKQGTGGWVKKGNLPWEDGLYCVASAYDIEHLETDLEFQIALLKHEAQHFADKTDYPNLCSVDLEYRAKLVEMIYFPDIKDCFVYIVREALRAKNDPHRFASHCILQKLSEIIFKKPYVKDEDRWVSIPYEKIQKAAAELLREHTLRLRKSPQTSKSFINCL